jgi:hypothetical protein
LLKKRKEDETIKRRVACIWENRKSYRIFVGKPEEVDHFGSLGMNVRIILK